MIVGAVCVASMFDLYYLMVKRDLFVCSIVCDFERKEKCEENIYKLK